MAGIHAALGMRAHSGWAALVAVAGDPRAPQVVARERIEMTDPRSPGSRQPYHAVEGWKVDEARRQLRRWSARATDLAARAVGRAVEDLRRRGYAPGAAAILQSSGRLPASLEAVLASHPFIHTADGQHFRDALAAACERSGLTLARVPERGLAQLASTALRAAPEELAARVAALGRPLGRPWTVDQKSATLAAWLLLADAKRPRGQA